MTSSVRGAPPVHVIDNLPPAILAYSIPGLAQATTISKSSIYEEAQAGRLKLTHRCGRTIVLAEDATAWLRGETAQAGGAH